MATVPDDGPRIEQGGRLLSLPVASGRLEVTALTSTIARLRFVFANSSPSAGYVVDDLGEAPNLSAAWDSLHRLRIAALSLAVTADPSTVHFGMPGASATLQLPLQEGVEVAEAPGGRTTLALHFSWDGEQHFYGLGEGGKQFDRMDGARQLWNSHFIRGAGSDIGVPLLISSAGYALFFDCAYDAQVVVGRTERRSEIVFSAATAALDVYYLAGETLREVLGAVSTLLGKPPLPPRWSLGFLQSSRHFDSRDELLRLAETLREKRIPCDGLVFLSTYGDGRGWNRAVGHLEFESTLFADPAGTLAAFRAQHFQVITHEYPVLHPDSSLFAEAEALGYLVDEGYERIVPTVRPTVNFQEGQRYIDFSSPEARAWWWGQHRSLADLGVSGWWLDGGEGPSSHATLSAGSGSEVHNLYDRMRQQGFAAGEQADYPERRPFMLCRSGAAGMQRFGASCWSGDVNNTFATLEAQVPLGLNTALSAIPYWGTDIGGFFHPQPETAELYVRWFQFGAFCPGFRSHGYVWREHVPWAFGPQIEAVCRAFAELRYRLMPYTYTLAWQAYRFGLPLMRPMVLNYADDPEVWELGSQYLWGDDLLVAPVTRAGARSWPVYLPKGRWFDFWTNEPYQGPGGVSADAPLERMPLFVRGGAILPLAPVAQYDGELPWELVTLLIYPDGESAFELYDDDGSSRRYLDGHYATTLISCSARQGGVTIRVAPPAGDPAVLPARRRYVLQVLSPEPASVRVDGVPIARAQYSRAGEHFTVITMEQPHGDVDIEW